MTASTNTSIEEAIEAARHGRKTVILCPGHEDKAPSLSIGPGTNQPVLLNCHANCDPKDIVEAAGLSWDDVCVPRDEMGDQIGEVWTPAGTTQRRFVYDYCDEDGTVLYVVFRVPQADGSKRFVQGKPDPMSAGRYLWSLGDVKRVPWRLPQIIEAVAAGRTIHITEGEKCAKALDRVIPEGDVATCNSGGAGKFLGAYAHYFAGAKIVLYADADDPGRQHVRDVREILEEVNCSVRTLEAPPGVLRNGKAITDVADHLEAGRSLNEMLETTPESDVQRARTGYDILDVVLRPKKPVEWAIEGTLALGERLLLTGLEGRGKSTLLRQMAVCTAAGIHPFFGTAIEPKRVLFIDAENHPDQVVESWANLVGLCVRHSHPIEPGMLTLLEEWDSDRDLTSREGAAWLKERVYGYRPHLLIMGPLTNLVARDLSEYEQVNRLRNSVDSVRSICNSAIAMEHHAPLRSNGDKIREVRPYGNGLFLKWPDYGYAMVPTDDEEKYEWRANRGPRVRSRRWPSALRQGNQHVNSIEFPWVEAVA